MGAIDNADGASISIHAPHEGCDAKIKRLDGRIFYFNPRTP